MLSSVLDISAEVLNYSIWLLKLLVNGLVDGLNRASSTLNIQLPRL